MNAERRRRQRYAVGPDQRVTCAVGGLPGAVPVVDLGALGVLVEVAAEDVGWWPGLAGRVGAVTVFIGDAAVLRCDAEVVWFGGERRAGARRLRVGLRFLDLPAAEARRLEDRLADLAPEG